MIELLKFEKLSYCQLTEGQIEHLKSYIEHNIAEINRGLEKGYEKNSSYIQSYHNELTGYILACAIVGINVEKTPLYKRKRAV